MAGESSSTGLATVRRLRGAPAGVRVAIVAVFVVSLGLRVVLAAAVKPVLVSDARDYHVLAKNLADGRGYVQVYEGETEAFQGFTFRAFRPPGYPVFLAALYTVSSGWPYAYLAANIVADLVTQVCFLLIAARLFGAGPALLVQILLTLHVLWTPNPMTESVYTAVFAVLALLLVWGLALRSWGGALGFGVVAAGALFVRPITICVFPALLWRFARERRSVRGAGLFALTLLPAVIGISLWAWRNYRIFGEFVPFTTNVGHHNAYDFGLPADHEFAELRARGLNEAQINAALMRKEWAIGAARPVAAVMTWVTRVGELFSLKPAWELRNVLWTLMFRPTPEESLVYRVYRLAYRQYYVTYALAALGALVLALRRNRLGGLWPLMFAYVGIHALVSRGDVRLMAPLYPMLCLLVGGLWAAGREQLGRARRATDQASMSKPPAG